MPVIVRPDPPPPMSVAIATRVFGSEVLVALIRHYRGGPSSQAEAAAALDLPHQLISHNTRLLATYAVVRQVEPHRGRIPGRFIVDEYRLEQLATALVAFTLGRNLREFDVDAALADPED